ncbi:hypothetical protein GCM10010505_66370 [Kitasatospora aburaviensis]
MTTEIAGVRIPDSRLATEATELVRDASTDLLYHHSRRAYLFGALQGRRRGLAFGNVKADVLARFGPGFERTDFTAVIEGSAWPE